MTNQKPLKIAVASGKGGTGKTFVSTNLFFVAQETGIKTCLVDCDAEEPNVLGFLSGELNYAISATQKIPVIDKEKCSFCGKCKDYCQFNAIFMLPFIRFIQVTPELCHSCGACLVACKFGAISETDLEIGTITSIKFANNAEIIESKIKIGMERPGEIIKTAQKRVPENTELVIFDSPPGTSCPFIATVENADIVLMIAEPTPFGLNDLKLSVEVLKQIGKPIYAIINKHGIGNDEAEKYLNIQKIEIIAKIPFDKTIAQIYSTGKIVAKENSKYADLFKQALNKLTIQ